MTGMLHGLVEPHAGLRAIPTDEQPLFKVMSVGNFLKSIDGSYMYFNRVDSYVDSPLSDPNDGEQLPSDFDGNAMAKFAKAPSFSAADYYARCRSRTYACCALAWNTITTFGSITEKGTNAERFASSSHSARYGRC